MGNAFTKKNTIFVKGIAVIMLLIHHLFYSTTYPYNEFQIFGINFWNMLAFFCKTTVSIFVILSGFGLYKSFFKEENIKYFYLKNLKKIYLNYWMIWLLFVPIGILLYGRTLDSAYGDHIITKLIINLTGFQQYFNFWGYNPTWWFITLILSLYIIFPILYRLSKNKYTLEILFLISCLGFLFSPKFELAFLFYFIPSFILGMLISKHSLFEKTCYMVSENKRNLMVSVFIFAALLLCRVVFGKWFTNFDAGANTIFDMFIAYIIIYSTLFFNKLSESISREYIKNMVTKLGVLSFYIFLFHTFVFGFYYSEYSFSLKSPILILFNFIVICVAIAELIEVLKQELNSLYIKCRKKETL